MSARIGRPFAPYGAEARVFAGLAMFAGLLCFLVNLWMTARGAEATDPLPARAAGTPAA